MDYKQLRKSLAEQLSRTPTDIDALVDGLSVVLRQSASNLDNVAVPTFGTFKAVKHEEMISEDLSTGKRMLLPPEIVIEFEPGASLVRRINPIEPVIPIS